MGPVRELVEKFRESEGRIRAKTATGVLALAAIVALALGVLPALATHVTAVQVNWGGGPGACSNSLTPLGGGAARGPSSAAYELHIQNPKNGQTYTDPATGLQVQLSVTSGDTKVAFELKNLPAMAVRDIVINGGKKSNHSDYDAEGKYLREDSGLMAPAKDNQPGQFHKVSHINICYDLQPTFFECGADAVLPVEIESEFGDIFTVVTARIFTNDDNPSCDDKFGFFFTDWPETEDPDVLLDFGDEGETSVTGRLDITKDFGSPPFTDIRYLHGGLTSGAVDVSWCNIRAAVAADLDTDGDGNPDGNPFADVLDPGDYPTLAAVGSDPAVTDEAGVPAVACKVHVEETATGIQWNVIYFDFLDPNFF